VNQFAADNWVWGESKPSFTVSNRLKGDVTDLYERDYSATWDAVLDDIELVPFGTLAQAADALNILAGATSPLKGLLGVVADNTALVEQGKAPSGAVEAAKKGLREKVGNLFDKLPEEIKGSPALPGALVTAHFQPIQRLMAGEPGNAPIDQILLRIGQLQHHLGSLASDPASTPPDALTDPQLREILLSLREEAATMPPVIQRLVAQIGSRAEGSVGSSASSELEKHYRQEVLQPCNAVLADRYPFTVTSSRELPMVDFARVFAYGGLFDRFFAQNLEPLIDASQSSWTWRPGAVAGSRELLEKFQAAQRIRDLFFRRGSPAPDVRFTVNTAGVDSQIPRFVLEIDGQFFDSHDPRQIRQAVWPGPTPGRASARIAVQGGAQTQDDALGAWGLFRLFDRHAQRVTDTRFVLGFDVNGQEARVMVDADRVDNPFARRDWQRFSCGP
jgi:type VI secretion system protein ImpL